jgi:creatinine amidohydrolase
MQLADLTWPAVDQLSPDLPVVVPIAALEQHGHHLPLFTDSLLLGEVVRRAAERLGERALWTPLVWLGNSQHHLDFPGTLTAAPRTYLDLLGDLLENLLAHGFRRLLLLNGHGGNIVPAQQAVFEVRQRHRHRSDLLLLSACYWQLGSPPSESIAGLRQEQMGHACEWETSMILRLAPHLAGDYRAARATSQGSAFAPAARGWTTRDRTVAGHLGDPAAATSEKGEALLALFARDAVELVERMLAWDGSAWNG